MHGHYAMSMLRVLGVRSARHNQSISADASGSIEMVQREHAPRSLNEAEGIQCRNSRTGKACTAHTYCTIPTVQHFPDGARSSTSALHSVATNCARTRYIHYTTFHQASIDPPSGLPPKTPLLQEPRSAITHKRKRESQLESNIPTKRAADHAPNGPKPPHLRHPDHSARNPTAKRKQRRIARRQFRGLVVRVGRIPGEPAAEDEVFGQRDALVNREPVRDHQHEVLEHGLEVGVAGDRDCAVDGGGDEGPDEARDVLGVVGEDLDAEADAVDVGAVVADDGEGDDDEAEVAEGAEGQEHCGEEAADCVVGVGG